MQRHVLVSGVTILMQTSVALKPISVTTTLCCHTVTAVRRLARITQIPLPTPGLPPLPVVMHLPLAPLLLHQPDQRTKRFLLLHLLLPKVSLHPHHQACSDLTHAFDGWYGV